MSQAAKTETKPLPGTFGPPLIGETLSFLRDPYRFVGERADKHGPIFRTNILGRDTAVIAGAEAGAAFIDLARVKRDGSQPKNVFRLFAGPSLPHLDDAAHADRKAIILSAFTPEALASYLPAMQARIAACLTRWAAQEETPLLDELKRLALEGVCADIMGITDRARLDTLLADYEELQPAFTGLPIPLPGTAYKRGLDAVDRIFASFGDVVQAHRDTPHDDGLARILGTTAPSGTKINDDQAKRELHHLVIAGRVVYTHLVGLIMQLAQNPAIRDRAAEEIARLSPSGPLALETLDALPYTKLVLMEVKRVAPVVPGMFANATEDIPVLGHVIPKGWMIMFGLYRTHQASDAYPDPEKFVPERFAAPREEHRRKPNGYCPHGPGAPKTSHHCAGTDYATALAMVFATLLLREYAWVLPEQDLSFDWSRLTPDPRDGVRTRIRKSRGGAR
jgi:cytochrome P450